MKLQKDENIQMEMAENMVPVKPTFTFFKRG